VLEGDVVDDGDALWSCVPGVVVDDGEVVWSGCVVLDGVVVEFC
jgi:hypothetical protein